jgi:hypothetical protein
VHGLLEFAERSFAEKHGAGMTVHGVISAMKDVPGQTLIALSNDRQQHE